MSKKPADKEDIAKLEKLIVDGFDRINCLINLLAASINPPPAQYGTSTTNPIGVRHHTTSGEILAAGAKLRRQQAYAEAQKEVPWTLDKINKVLDTETRFDYTLRFVGNLKTYNLSCYAGQYQLSEEKRDVPIDITFDFEEFKKTIMEYFSHTGGAGEDGCLGRLPGVKFACCGHGGKGYIIFENDTKITFEKLEVENENPL